MGFSTTHQDYIKLAVLCVHQVGTICLLRAGYRQCVCSTIAPYLDRNFGGSFLF